MNYLFTYKNGKKALGLSNINTGLAIKAGETTVYPLLVSPSAENASCVRIKLNNEIKALSYVPSLVIPGVLCGKSGTEYTDPIGINFTNKFYDECFYDLRHGQYIAHSHYRDHSGTRYEAIAISKDAKNWKEKWLTTAEYIRHPLAVINTKIGVLVCTPVCNVIDTHNWNYTLDVSVYYQDGNTIKSENINTLEITNHHDPTSGEYYLYKCTVCSNRKERVIISCEGVDRAYGNYYEFQKTWSINLDTGTVSVIRNVGGYDGNSNFIKKLWYNTVLNQFCYKLFDDTYVSDDGVNFTAIQEDYYESFGNINGAEVFENGLSYDGITIGKSYTYRPNAYDPIEQKYIRVVTGWTSGGGSVIDTYWFDIYESIGLNNWTYVTRKYNNTAIWPQTSPNVNTDGFACVKGF